MRKSDLTRLLDGVTVWICTQVGFTATPEDRELATLGNPLHCFPLSAAIQHGFVLDVLRDFRAPRLPVTVFDAVSKRPVDDARLRRLALDRGVGSETIAQCDRPDTSGGIASYAASFLTARINA